MEKVIIENPNIEISSDEEESEEDFIPYKQRPNWADVQPVAQNDGPYSVVTIRYSEQFEETYNYFRAVLASKEISERALQLTDDCIKLNPSNYTVWHYRRVLLEKLSKSLVEELEYIESVISKNHKNYQVWEHYKYVLNRIKEQIDQKLLPDVDLKELSLNVKRFIHIVLADDSKNYHAWQQLQWLIKYWAQWEGELDYVAKLVDDDIRNNSAWNHRFYVIQNTTNFTEDVIESECEYTIKLIKLAPNNESAWNYLLGVLRKSKKDLDSFPSVIEACETLNQDNETRSSYLLSFMVTHLSEKMHKIVQQGSADYDQEQFKQIYDKAIDLCNQLATKLDTLRIEYWKYQANLLVEKYKAFV